MGFIILPLYFVATIAVGWFARRRNRGANAYLNASRSLPLAVVTAAYLAANCGALEIVGLSAMAAQYGVQAFSFYWIGAIPAMIFLALWMMPVYRRSRVESVPEYLQIRYGSDVRLLNACTVALLMLLLGGISLYAMAQVLEVVVGFSFAASVLLSAGVVLVYVLMGGLRATIYNEVLQLAVMLGGLAPLAFRSWRAGAASLSSADGLRGHLWHGLPIVSRTAPLDGVGVVIGLGFVLSFGYWCTDFVLMQRAFAARTDEEARMVPLLAGFGKLAFSLIVVLPGAAAARLLPELGHTRRFDQALPAIMTQFYGPTMLGLGLTALAASLMSGFAANISAFSAIWTGDIYRAYLRKDASDEHYLRMGRISTAAAVAVSVAASLITFLFNNLMEHVQLIFSVFGSPFWAIFLLGMSSKRVGARGAVWGFLGGSLIGLLHLLAYTRGWILYGSSMSSTFYGAIYAFSGACAIAWLTPLDRNNQPHPVGRGVIFRWKTEPTASNAGLWILSGMLLLACVVLNVLWR
jgi:SSS family solute:Na+ symporter